MKSPFSWITLAAEAAEIGPEDGTPAFELYNLDQLEAHGRALAVADTISADRIQDRLLPRLADNARCLREVCDRVGEAHRAGRHTSPAGEWLLDNVHLIEEHVAIARRHLPKGYSRALPHLGAGPFAGFPRVYHLAIEVIAHVDGRIDRENIGRFVEAWQTVTPLTLGELWAVPIMLRLALLEHLRRVAARVELAMAQREQARVWAAELLAAAERDPRSLLLASADMARANPPLTNAFVAEFVQRLQERSSLVAIPLTWLDHELAELGTSLHHRVQSEYWQQAANQVSVGSAIGSLRFLDATPWHEFVEEASRVERTLRRDPTGVYATMDFATRDRYRHVVEDLARETHTDEATVAAAAVALAAEEAADEPEDEREGHVGFYLLDRGLPALRRVLPGASRWARARAEFGRPAAVGAYFGTIAGVTIAVALLLAAAVVAPWHAGPALWLGTFLVASLCASQLAVACANGLATRLQPPRVLPRIDFSIEIPDACRTIVVVPTMLTDRDAVDALIEGLEVRYLGNRDPNLRFGLLTDFADAETETMPDDAALLDAAHIGIGQLNARYRRDGVDPFLLLHRPRQWNARERVWMGYERKRGKLEALNHLLRGRDRLPGASRPAFSLVVGDVTDLGTVRFVITLDTDTQLPRDAAHKLVGTLAHPLNRARHDPRTGAVIAGYGILQPRVAINLPATRRSWFVRLYAGEAGTDPYTTAVSDVYQDLFGEGSFVGKGIYDVDAFSRALDARFADNLILSHDLIEGCYARSGLVSDVLLYEDHPSHYGDDRKRRRRWIRGDWQLLYWLLPWAPDRDGRWRRTHLSALSYWKLTDNLRRSLVPVAALILLAMGFSRLPGAPTVAVCVLAVYLLPALLASLMGGMSRPKGMGLAAHLVFESRAVGKRMAHAGAALLFLPEDAWGSVDSIVRALTRMWVTGRRLLEWRPPTSERRAREWGIGDFYRAMPFGPVLGVGLLALLLAADRPALPASLLLVVAWIGSPAAAAWLSRPLLDRVGAPSPEQTRELRKLARRTWRFFDTYVGADDNALPPDNVQFYPTEVVAHRTSPTNIGLSLLANLAAHDFGYISTASLLRRTGQTFASMSRMERFRGHFYNWYDTRTLAPLQPLYLSTVDSGNLSGHLLTLQPGLRALTSAPVVSPQAWAGLADTVDLLTDAAPDLAPGLATLRRELDVPPEGDAAIRARAVVLQAAFDTLAAGTAPRSPEARYWVDALARQCRDVLTEPLRADAEGGEGVEARDDAAERLAGQCEAFAAVEYDFLFDETRRLLCIGYNVSDHRRDAGCYDLLASEARLASYVAIAQGSLPQSHWFALGRLLTTWRNEALLVSWSGSMFEYLMPLLVMPNFPGTLLEQTCATVVRRQIEYGARLGIPWGVSESGYSATDANLNYQYKAFGVPGLGFKRGLGDERVIAPYATVMALLVAPEAACANLTRLREAGFEGPCGFYEAIDYTPTRLAAGQPYAVIRSFMAHHQGMSLLALLSILRDQPMQRRFRSRPSFQATELLLQERVPKQTALYPHAREAVAGAVPERAGGSGLYVIPTANTPRPEVHLLSNGRYSVMITNAGGGFSRWRQTALTRWREDPTRDPWGTFCYVRDVESDALWSSAHQPTGAQADHYEAIFSQARAEFRRRDHEIELHTEISVSPEDDVELRRYSFTNLSSRTRTLEITTYAEIVLAPQADDDAHPAFSKLFLQTEVIPARQAILCTRRARAEDESTPVLLHLLAVHGPREGEMSFETDRRRFLGRGGDGSAPPAQLSGTDGAVLDPVVAIRCRLVIPPDSTVTAHLVTGVAPTRDAALVLVDRYTERHLGDRVFELAWTHRQVVLGQLGITEAEAQLYLQLASSILYANPARRAASSVLAKNRRGQSSLWAYGISGDLPIVLLRTGSDNGTDLVRQLIRAHGYWRSVGLAVDLVLSNEDETGYQTNLNDQLLAVVAGCNASAQLSVPGGIYILRRDEIAEEDQLLLQTVARVVLTGAAGAFAEQVARRARPPYVPPAFVPSGPPAPEERMGTAPSVRSPANPTFPNGLGGMAADGREYQITTSKAAPTPAPWVNVLANPHFGSVVSESGAAYTWCENAHELRLTPWENDPVTDSSGEAFYLRDESSGVVWGPTAAPVRSPGAWRTHHGFGYSTHLHRRAGIESELTSFVAVDAPVKITIVRLVNRGDRARTLSLTAYCEWVLGELRARSLLHVTSELDPTNGALLARKPFHPEFGARIGFLHAGERLRSYTADRTEFIGRNGDMSRPAGLGRERLSGRVGAGLDACSAAQVSVDLAPGEARELTFLLGVGRDVDDVRTLVRRFGRTPAAREALAAVHAQWAGVLGAVQVETPEPTLDVMVNGWLPYQTLACRMWARTGLYQSGGAFGFRDQLQDAMALLYVKPDVLREHILRSCGRQFRDGDVQHWWHPPSGRGVRTHCSDDYLWLPVAVARYVESTGDTGILEVRSRFIEGRQVKPDEEAYADLPRVSEESATVYDHCVAALRLGLRVGVHGLPLMGSGDWNDGMNRVGHRGRGESVWLGFFLHDALTRFATVARGRGDAELVDVCVRQAAELSRNLEEQAWDGAWYKRAWFDTGEPLGAAENAECQVDSLPQSWAALTGATDPDRARTAMEAVDTRLVDREGGIVRLFTPPFQSAEPNPGYIMGYVRGVRENGGQYTHAAVWVAMAFARLGDTRRAWEIANLLNPLHHTTTPEAAARYRVEPYVMAADVYGEAPHRGLGGWTWHTGSAGWMYRLYLESLLGFHIEVDRLTLRPQVPAAWPGFVLTYRHRRTHYRIEARAVDAGPPEVTLDGAVLPTPWLPLVDDAGTHLVTFTYPRAITPG